MQMNKGTECSGCSQLGLIFFASYFLRVIVMFTLHLLKYVKMNNEIIF